MVGTLLVDNCDNYVLANGDLPGPRPKFDKALLTEFCRGKKLSTKAYKMLPPSIQRYTKGIGAPEHPVTIRELAYLATLLIVTRVDSEAVGKKFRFEAFTKIADFNGLEIWKRK